MIINMNGAKAPETPSPVLQEKTVTPETLPTVIGPDEGYDGLSQVTVNPDAQLKAENIRSGKTIFGVAGAFVGEPTAGVELDKVGISTSIPLGRGMYATPDSWVSTPERLSELSFTTRWIYNDVTICYISYDNGCIASSTKTSYSTQSSTYIPDVTSYKWYHNTATISAGVKEFYFSYSMDAVTKAPTHIKGTLFLFPSIIFTDMSEDVAYGLHLWNDGSFISKPPNPIEISVDTDLIPTGLVTTSSSQYKFALDVPESICDIYGFVYSSVNVKYLANTYIAVPKTVVIS